MIETEKFLSLLNPPGGVVEVRILDCPRPGMTTAGYFNDYKKLTEAVSRYDGKANIYATLNPVNPALLARATNRLVERLKNTTGDGDIIARRWLLVDIDPVRPSGIAATDGEKGAAKKLAQAIYTWLKGEGWPEPVTADSGNGYYLLYRVDLPNDGESRDLIQNCLAALSLHFDNEQATIDTSVYNAARIIRLIGTVNAKGDNIPERPHRRSKLLRVPEGLAPVPVEKLRELAALAPKPQYEPRMAGEFFDLEHWIAEHGLPVVQKKKWQNGTAWILNPCPMNPEHTNKSAFIVQFSNGAIGAGCHHNSCQGWGWRELREKYEPGAYDRPARGRQKGGEKASTKSQVTPAVVCLNNVQPEAVSWLWEPYIPAGKITVLEGDPGVGKTWVGLAICTRLTKRGRAVLYATAEDGLADTIRPRAEGMGADLSRFYVLRGAQNGEGVLPFTLADPEVLEGAIEEYRPALVVLDPLQFYIGPDVDMHKANETRSRLALLAAMAEKYGCGIVLIRHLTKSQMDRGIYRGLGTIDIAAAARSVLLVGKTQDGTRALVQIKNSLAEYGQALGFEIRQGHFFWTGEVDISAEDLLRPEAGQEEKTALEEAVEWLQGVLADGPTEARTILKEARQAGIAERTLNRAKAALRVTSQKMGNNWVWKLATEERFSYCTNVGNLGNVDFSPTAARDSGNDSRLPIGNLEIQPSSPTAARPEGKIANIAKENIVKEKDIGSVQIRKVMGADELRRILDQATD